MTPGVNAIAGCTRAPPSCIACIIPRSCINPVNQDLQMKFGDEVSRQLLMKWDSSIAPVILKLAEQTSTTAIRELFMEFNENKDSSSYDCLGMYALLICVFMLPTHARSKGMRKQSLNMLIDFRPIGTVLEKYLTQDRPNRQPYLLCLGTRSAPTQFFIIGDRQAIKCEDNIVAAVDKLFKLHFVFNLQYAAELKLFYNFIETFVFKLSPLGQLPNKLVEIVAAIESCSSS
ncbi:hypothetical protein BSL78_16306 [Apostichopus japonicus]|uniref:Uncharacterized protein n=1 Tax=Stichopus japonicus TaxID=307972 RepID=A0A2G8KFN4_STIJA|nr:hypothetical protein BSL78_16306 [Apostichopus japonicus]